MKLRVLGMIISAGIMIVLFQNCQGSGESNFSVDQFKNRNSVGASQGVDISGSQMNMASEGVGSSGNNTLKVSLVSSTGAQMDCSREDATLTQEITNAPADILMCLEYALAMPAGSQRAGERFECQSSNKFLLPASSWSYNQALRKWTTAVSPLKNHPYLVPGSYTLVVKDNTGRIYRSQAAIIRKTNAENCLVGSSSANVPAASNGTTTTIGGGGPITVAVAPLAGSYSSLQALLDKANALQVDSCITLDGRQIYLGFGPCISAVSQGGAGVPPSVPPVPPVAQLPSTPPLAPPASPTSPPPTSSPQMPTVPPTSPPVQTPPAIPSNCPAVANVAIKNLAWTSNTGNTFMERPSKNQIISFRVTPSSARIGQFSTAFTGGAKATRVVVVSRCPGDFDHPLNTYCSTEGFEYAGFNYNSHFTGGANKLGYCNLNINETVYINIKNASFHDLNRDSCDAVSCPFYHIFK